MAKVILTVTWEGTPEETECVELAVTEYTQNGMLAEDLGDTPSAPGDLDFTPAGCDIEFVE
jgi:hypothetical protein